MCPIILSTFALCLTKSKLYSSPFIFENTLVRTDVLIKNKDADSVRSVSPVRQHPYRMFEIMEDGFLDPLMKDKHPEPYLLRRQDLPDLFYYNCVIDVTRYRTIKELGSMTGSKILSYIMDDEEVIDVDTPLDLEIVRKVFNDKL